MRGEGRIRMKARLRPLVWLLAGPLLLGVASAGRSAGPAPAVREPQWVAPADAAREARADILVRAGTRAERAWRLTEAAGLYRTAASWLRQAGSSPERQADALQKLSRCERQQGELVAGWRDILTALDLLEHRENQGAVYLRSLRTASDLARLRNDHPAARYLASRALELASRQSPRSETVAMLEIELGNAELADNHLTAAQRAYGEACSLLQEITPRGGAMEAVLLNVSIVLFDRHRFEEARSTVDEAIRLGEARGRRSARLAHSFSHRARCYAALDQFDSAEADFRRSLQMWEQTAPGSPTRRRTMFQYADFLRERGRTAEALRLADETWKRFHQSPKGDGAEEGHEAASPLQSWSASVFVELLVDSGQVERAVQILEQSRGQSLWRSIHDPRRRPASTSDAQWTEYQRALVLRDESEAQLALAGDARARVEQVPGKSARELARTKATLRTAQERQVAARLRADALWSRLAPAADAEARPDPEVMIRRARSAAAGGTAVAEYLVTRKRTLLFLFTPDAAGSQLSVYRIPITDRELVAKVRRLSRSLREARGDAGEQSRALRELLVPDAALSGLLKARRVVVVPDAVLWELPFGALALPATVRSDGYLGLARPLSVSPSLALAVMRPERELSRLAGTQPEVLAVGDPAFGTAASPVRGLRDLPASEMPLPAPEPLPATRTDAVAIAQLYGGTPLLGAEATEPAVRRLLQTADIAHLATHGYVHPYWAGASRIYLAGREHPATTAEDGVLEAWEIAEQLHLRAELVVLAACETNRGSVIRGEGVDGLVRSLLRVGARSVLASHWQVQADVTRTLMLAFHRGVRAGLAKDVALQQAAREVARRTGCEHPYYWASFVLTGDPENRLFGARKGSGFGVQGSGFRVQRVSKGVAE